MARVDRQEESSKKKGKISHDIGGDELDPEDHVTTKKPNTKEMTLGGI